MNYKDLKVGIRFKFNPNSAIGEYDKVHVATNIEVCDFHDESQKSTLSKVFYLDEHGMEQSTYVDWVDLVTDEAGECTFAASTYSEEVMSRFSFHKPDADGVENMRTIRRKVRELANLIDTLCPKSREQATALTQLSFVMMSANSAIVQQYPIDEKDV